MTAFFVPKRKDSCLSRGEWCELFCVGLEPENRSQKARKEYNIGGRSGYNFPIFRKFQGKRSLPAHEIVTLPDLESGK